MKTRSLLLFLIAILTAISVTAQSKMRIIEKSGSKTVVELNDVESINLFQEPRLLEQVDAFNIVQFHDGL